MHLQPAPQRVYHSGLAGTLYSWWRGDQLADLPALEGLSVARIADPRLLGSISRLDAHYMEARMDEGDVAYVAQLDGDPAAWGWSAWRQGQVGEIGIEFPMPEGNRYLWDFVTVPEMRGRGVYPRLLQEILRIEQEDADRFWIGHESGNEASSRGILKAGFQITAEVWIASGQPVIAAPVNYSRAAAAASLFRIPFRPTSDGHVKGKEPGPVAQAPS